MVLLEEVAASAPVRIAKAIFLVLSARDGVVLRSGLDLRCRNPETNLYSDAGNQLVPPSAVRRDRA